MTRRFFHISRLMKSGLLVIFIAALVRPALATDPIYQNFGVQNYVVPGNPPPTIDVTAFDNENTFEVSYDVFQPNTMYYEPMNTLYYTNGDNGIMAANGPNLNNGFLGSFSYGVGLRFDTQTTNSLTPHLMAGTFYNAGEVHCDSVLDGNGIFFFGIGSFLLPEGVGECIISATNIINPGTVVVGLDGFAQLTGQTVDLSRSVFAMEGATANVFGSGAFGTDTNADWNPFFDLTATTAESSAPFFLFLPNSTAYFDFASPGPSNNIIRAVFIEDTSPSNVSYNVYFNSAGLGLGSGAATVEWRGSVVDPVSGNASTNYLYLNDDYALGASTNVFLFDGYPDNFTFTESTTPLIFQPPATAGFFNVYPNANISNNYAYVTAQLISTTAATNASGINPSGALTNLPGRLEIKAGKDLDLSLAQLTGQNYMSLQSSNQFEGSAGALIVSPYADINVGVTNGFLTVSNLMSASIPNWSGTVQAWSTRFLSITTNGITNDFRVLIVGSQLNPSTLAYVQDLILHGTNSIVISDEFNILRKLSIDAQNLTVTTNGAGNGSTSLEGELNLLSGNLFLQTSMPNIRNLTNNGAIRSFNAANFGGPLVVSVIASTQAVAAIGTLTDSGTGATNNDTVTIGLQQYTFVKTVNNAVANEIKVGTSADNSMTNFIAAINGGVNGGKYSTATTPNTQVTASPVTNHAFRVTAITAGSAGNSIATTTTSSHLTWNGHATLFGGTDFVPAVTNIVSAPYDTFINNTLISDAGSTIYANYFENSGIFTNGIGNFYLYSINTILTNGSIYAGGDVSITTGSLVTSNLILRAGRSLTLQVTNLLTDTGVTNGNIWSVGNSNGAGGNGLILPIKPPVGDLLGTTISNYAPGPNKQVAGIWAGQDRGTSTAGYTNDVAIGHLIFDALGANSSFKFTGAGVSNALYVDLIDLRDFATNTDGGGNFTVFNIGANMVIYYADARENGVSVAAKMNHKNSNRLRWVPAYAGYFTSTNYVYPDGTTNTFNTALAQSSTLDSDGDGVPNGSDPTPIFVPSQWDVSITMTNIPFPRSLISWHSIPNATNTVQYSTNLVTWFLLTNFVSPTLTPPAGGWPITNMISDPIIGPMRMYQVMVFPTTTNVYGP
jgi:hypothetical protein